MPVPVLDEESASLNRSEEPVADPNVNVEVSDPIVRLRLPEGLDKDDQRGEPPIGAHPVALPLAAIPVGALPVEH